MRTLIRLVSAFIARHLEHAWRRRDDRSLAPLDAAPTRVRIRNLNYALLPFAISLLMLALLVFFVCVAIKKKLPLSQGWPYLAAFLAFAVFGFAIGCRRILWVDLGSSVIFRRLLSAISYDPQQIQTWGFEIARGRLTHSPPLSDSNFLLAMHDGIRLEVVVSSAKARRIAIALAHQHQALFTQKPG